jgi:predicted membrane protein
MSRNAPALGSVLAGLLAAAAIPATVAYAYWSDRLPLIWAGVAVPAAILLALLAFALARRGERRARMTLLTRSGSAAVRLGRLLATLGLVFAGSGLTALAVYAALTYRGGS